MSIEAVIFDFGGVIGIREDWSKRIEVSETCQMHSSLLYYHSEPFARK